MVCLKGTGCMENSAEPDRPDWGVRCLFRHVCTISGVNTIIYGNTRLSNRGFVGMLSSSLQKIPKKYD